MKKYEIKVSYTFTGTVTVNAESKDRAKEIVNRDFGMVSGNVSCSNESDSTENEGVSDWDINNHATTVKIR